MRGLPRFAALALLGVLAACGTTVPQRSQLSGAQAAAAAGADNGLGAPAATETQGGSAATSAPAGSVTGGALPPAGTGPVASGPAAATGRPAVSGASPRPGTKPSAAAVTTKGAGTAAVVNAPGVTAKTITVGLIYSSNAASEQQALGANATQTNTPAEMDEEVKYVNDHGGLGGRTVNYIPDNVDATDPSSVDTQAQEMCDKFTTDNKVLAVVFPGPFRGGQYQLASCLSKRGVLLLTSSSDQIGENEFTQLSTYIDTLALTPESAMRNLPDFLARTDYFTAKWDSTNGGPGGALPLKYGVVYPDLPRWQDAVTKDLLPGLKAHGVSVDSTDVVEYHFPTDQAETAETVQEIQSAVLKLHSDNVTDVIPVEANALGFFAAGAEPQGYRPRYAINTSTGAQALETQGVVPARQLVGAVGIGWTAQDDLTDPSGYEGPGRSACLARMKAVGITYSDPTAEGEPLAVCDQLALLKLAIDPLGSTHSVTAASVTQGIEQSGSSFVSAEVVQGRFGPGRAYPTTVGWAMSWDAGCTCAKYSGSPVTLR